MSILPEGRMISQEVSGEDFPSLISIVIPVYNERRTIRQVLDRVLKSDVYGIQKEIVVVDDASTDGTWDILKQVKNEVEDNMMLIRHSKNKGKGAALRTGFAYCRGEIIIIQDADLEYDPGDYPKLLEPILKGKADVVYGSRFVTYRPHRTFHFWHYLGNKFLTLISNILTGLNLSDMETGYKVFRSGILSQILLKEERFGFEPEFTAKIARLGLRICEVGISYSGRTYHEGKKISWKDGLRALYCIIRYNLFR